MADLPVGLLNCAILTTEGQFTLRTVDLAEARAIVRDAVVDSAIGHAASARLLSMLLEIPVAVSRQEFRQQPNQRALVLRLHQRLPEGAYLTTLEQLQAVGFNIALLTRDA